MLQLNLGLNKYFYFLFCGILLILFIYGRLFYLIPIPLIFLYKLFTRYEVICFYDNYFILKNSLNKKIYKKIPYSDIKLAKLILGGRTFVIFILKLKNNEKIEITLDNNNSTKLRNVIKFLRTKNILYKEEFPGLSDRI